MRRAKRRGGCNVAPRQRCESDVSRRDAGHAWKSPRQLGCRALQQASHQLQWLVRPHDSTVLTADQDKRAPAFAAITVSAAQFTTPMTAPMIIASHSRLEIVPASSEPPKVISGTATGNVVAIQC